MYVRTYEEEYHVDGSSELRLHARGSLIRDQRNVQMHAVIDLELAGSLISSSSDSCQSRLCLSDRVRVRVPNMFKKNKER